MCWEYRFPTLCPEEKLMRTPTTTVSQSQAGSKSKFQGYLPGSTPVFCLAVGLAFVLVGCATEPSRFPEGTDPYSPISQPRASAGEANSPAKPAEPTAPSVTQSAGPALGSGLYDKRALCVGDHLSFRILEDNDEPKQLTVTDSGDVDVPFLGRHPAIGKSCKQLATELKQELEARYYYHATVIVSVDAMSRNLGRVYASGAVRAPGPLEIPGDEVFTLSKAILRAGGFADFADKHGVKVTRKSNSGATNETFTVDVGSILEKGRSDLDITLEPGDMFFVAERVIRF
jgi:polysaccharide export outer membrane protein